jgi:hypothetical protein
VRNRVQRVVRIATALLASLTFSVVAFAQATVFAPEGAEADVKFVPTQSRGVDQTLNYESLLKYGPWDDRNYELTKNDVAVLPAQDRFFASVPAFFKILKRREMKAQGFPLGEHYPREFNKEFSMRFGGLIQNGVHFLTLRGRAQWIGSPFRDSLRNDRILATDPIVRAAPVLSEGPFDGTISNNETTLEFAPHDPNLVVAGSNGTGDQRVAMSTDGGVTWTRQAFFTGTCCDPAHDWQLDGSVVYAASLTSQGTGGCGFSLCTGVYWSFNNGQNWNGPVNVSTASSDKEWVHVDKVATSPFRDRVYLTWHQGNVMQFARSTTQPVSGGASLTFAPTVSLSAEPTGIGSDIVTDRQGRVYYLYASLGATAGIRLLRSDDGGVTFVDMNGAAAGNNKLVFDLHGNFDFPIPAMESREVFIYAAADVDTSGGPRDGRVYVAFTDENQAAGSPGGGNGTAAQNHAWIKVAYSDDQGANWTVVTPHSTTDGATVDRFQPWIDVDRTGNVHVGWQDTRNSGAGFRDKSDWYYAVSGDGGTTWIEETRVSSETSQNITNGQEWGDYNGVSTSSDGQVVGFTWTDNRLVSGTASQRSFAGRVQNVLNGPGYNVGASTSDQNQSICARDPVSADPIDVSLTAFNGFTSPIVLSLSPLPNGITGSIAPMAVTAPATAIATMSIGTGVAPGLNTFQINASGTQAGTTVTRELPISFNVFTRIAAGPALSAPANNAVGQLSSSLVFSWAAAAQALNYSLEIATDAAFTNIVRTIPTTATSATVIGLSSGTQYFWRVTSSNPCSGAPASTDFRNGFEDPIAPTSGVFSFTTAAAPGDCPAPQMATTLLSESMETAPTGWTTAVGTGTMTWGISNAFPFAGTNAFRSVGTEALGDVRAITPAIAIPASGAPRLLFENKPGMEPRTAGGCWDAGLLEVSTDGGTTFTQITAGITGLGYRGAIQAPNPAAGLQGWCGAAGVAYARTAVDLTPYAGQSIRLRFRATADDSVAVADGWNIDNVKVQTCN